VAVGPLGRRSHVFSPMFFSRTLNFTPQHPVPQAARRAGEQTSPSFLLFRRARASPLFVLALGRLSVEVYPASAYKSGATKMWCR
jgi:hypothetical protein